MGSILRITWLAWSSHKWAAFGMIGVMVLWGISPIFELNALIRIHQPVVYISNSRQFPTARKPFVSFYFVVIAHPQLMLASVLLSV